MIAVGALKSPRRIIAPSTCFDVRGRYNVASSITQSGSPGTYTGYS
jgi:hypothetical protein